MFKVKLNWLSRRLQPEFSSFKEGDPVTGRLPCFLQTSLPGRLVGLFPSFRHAGQREQSDTQQGGGGRFRNRRAAIPNQEV
jgi:hypothetical protein